MREDSRVGRGDWLAGIVLGVHLGTVVLGVGGRVAMRGIAIMSGQPGAFSAGGSLAVVLLGAASGLLGALVFVALRWLVKNRILRAALFWTFLILITARGLHPLDLTRVVLFYPLILIYGAAFYLLWCRAYLPLRASPHQATS